MLELSPQQMQVLGRAVEAGFCPVAIPPYESALCLRRGDCAAVLTAIPNAGLRLMAPPTLLVDGNLSVKLNRRSGKFFVWKTTEVAATPDRLDELARFGQELAAILAEGPQQ
jgi:hypothetical protein